FSSGGIAPQGTATLLNQGIETDSGFQGTSQLVVQLYPGYSSATIPIASLESDLSSAGFFDCFFAHTNTGHYAKVLVTAWTSSTMTLKFTTFGVSGGTTSTPPTITAIRNNSSNIFAGLPNYGIAPSSIFLIIGSGLA